MPKDPDDAPATQASPDSRLARRQRRRERSRDEILDAARRVVLREGVAATTLELVAAEAGLSKAGLYYYFDSKDALLFDLVFASYEAQAKSVRAAVERAADGGEALRAIVCETIKTFSANLDDFRLAFLFAQVAGSGAVKLNPEQFARVRPLNDLLLAGATQKLEMEGALPVEPRLVAFLAFVSALGVLTMKGLVESMNDPLAYADDQLMDGLASVFEAAVRGSRRPGIRNGQPARRGGSGRS
jgi:AcrR family transcriptional regulator